MKVYEKPQLMYISLSANGALCQPCAIDAVGDNMDPAIKQLYELLGETIFTADTACEMQLEGYCKFTLTGDIIFNS